MYKYFFAIFFLISVIVYSINSKSNGYQIPAGSYFDVKTPAKTCVRVQNSTSSDIFAPTSTTAEWNAFTASLPSGVTLGSCPTCSGGGFYYNGFCYYRGALNESCDDICSSRGGCDATGTDYIGNAADDYSRCTDVGQVIMNSDTMFAVDSESGTEDANALGCVYTTDTSYENPLIRSIGRTQDCTFYHSTVQRFCACAN